MDSEGSTAAANFLLSTYSKVFDCEVDSLLYNANIYQDLTAIYLLPVGANGENIYDKQDRPLAFAFDALNIVEKLIDDEHSYIKSKAYVAIAKVYLQKEERQKAEELVEKAKSTIAALFTDDHPLSVKFNQNLIEAYNLRPESKERTQLVNEICARNVEISE